MEEFYVHLELLGKRIELGMTGYALYLEREMEFTFADILRGTGFSFNFHNLNN